VWLTSTRHDDVSVLGHGQRQDDDDDDDGGGDDDDYDT